MVVMKNPRKIDRDATYTRSLCESVNLYADIPRYRWFSMYLLSREPALKEEKMHSRAALARYTAFFRGKQIIIV